MCVCVCVCVCVWGGGGGGGEFISSSYPHRSVRWQVLTYGEVV